MIDANGLSAGVAESRDAQRALRDAMNEASPPHMCDDAMRELGFERVSSKGPVEERFRRST